MAAHLRSRDEFEALFPRAHRVVARRIYDDRVSWWAWASEVQDWAMNHGSGRFYWDLDGARPENYELWGVEYFFTDARTAVAFKLRWG